MPDGGSTVARRQLGRELKRARERAKLDLMAAAKALEWSRAKMYRIEGGTAPLRTLDVENMCKVYDVPPDMTEALVSLARQSKIKGWWHSYDDVIPGGFDLYLGMEAAASHIRHYEPALIPGLLQTAEYAAAVFRTLPGRTEAEIARKVAVRMERQELLRRPVPAPPTLEAIIDEAVLRRPIANADAWRRQLDYLIMAPSRAYNVSVRVLPLSVGPHRASVPGAFIILGYPPVADRAEPTTVYSENLTGSLYFDGDGEVTEYDAVWQALCADTLDVQRSASLIAAIIKEIGDA